MTTSNAAAGLAELTRRVEHDLELLDYPRRPWLAPQRSPSGEHVYDVVIVGGGQSGLTAAFGLLRERVGNLLVLDNNPLDRAGPWLNFARMRTLRTPKYLTGPDLGIPSLTPRAWYEAQFGDGSWEALGLLPKELWASYLAWYRETLHIPVEPETTVGALQYDGEARQFLVPLQRPCAGSACCKRAGSCSRPASTESGEWRVPRAVTDALPARLYAHTRDEIDFDALRGKRIAVLGAGASGFDNAATALELGAAEVHLFFRRPQLVNVNAYRWAEFVGFLKHHADLPDAEKWRFILQILRMGQLPPKDTLARAREHAGFHLHAGSSWKSVRAQGDTVLIETESDRFEVDFVIVATGCVTDLAARPELAHFEAQIARWADRYTPPAEESHEDLWRHPYLGPGFEFSERHPGQAPYLAHLYNYTFGGCSAWASAVPAFLV